MVMRKISVIMEKGGSGKTTLCTHLAVAAHLATRKVTILDTDPMEGIRAWGEARGRSPDVITELTSNPDYLKKTVAKIEATGPDLLVIDTPGAANPIASNVAMLSDFVIIPMKPSPHDDNAIWRTLERLTELKVPHAVVLNQCPTTTTRPEIEMRERLEGNKVTVCPTVIHQRQVIVDSAATGETAFEMSNLTKADRRAIDEFQSVYDWIIRQVGKPVIRQKGEMAVAS